MERLQNRLPSLGEAGWEELLLGTQRQGLLSIKEPLLPAGAWRLDLHLEPALRWGRDHCFLRGRSA